jgi:hypothetical protein
VDKNFKIMELQVKNEGLAGWECQNITQIMDKIPVRYGLFG